MDHFLSRIFRKGKIFASVTMGWVHRFRAAGAAADLDDLGVEGDGESLPVSVLPR